MKHFIKHLSLFDKIFFLLFVSLAILSGITGDWRGVVYTGLFAIGVLLLAAKDITIKHQGEIIERTLEVAEYAMKALGGGKLIKTTTIEFSVEKSKKAEGKKPNEKKQRNEDKANAGRSRSRSSKKPAGSSKTANAKGTRPASVPNRKPTNSKKNSKA